MPEMIRKQIFASGTVQGVNYRWFVLQNATDLGLKGWVRNLPDGRVEADVEGEPDCIATLLACMRTGPRLAHVENLETFDLQYEGKFTEFRVR
jgi:acylphosphatase